MRNRHVMLVVTVFLLFSIVGCYTIQYMPNGEAVRDSKRVLFLFWGLTPIGDNTVRSGMPVEEKFEFIDYLIQFVTLGILSSRTVQAK